MYQGRRSVACWLIELQVNSMREKKVTGEDLFDLELSFRMEEGIPAAEDRRNSSDSLEIACMYIAPPPRICIVDCACASLILRVRRNWV